MKFNSTTLLARAHNRMVDRLNALGSLSTQDRDTALTIVEEEITRVNPGDTPQALGGTGGWLQQIVHWLFAFLRIDTPGVTNADEVNERMIDHAMHRAQDRISASNQSASLRSAAVMITGLSHSNSSPATMDNSVVGALKQAALELSNIQDPTTTNGPTASPTSPNTAALVAQASTAQSASAAV